jgi:hypothetical protein
MEREGEALGTITADGTGEEGEMNIPDEPWHWIQDASGNAQTPTNLQEGEDIILEFNHDGPPPGIQDTVGWVPEATPSVAAVGHPAETKSSTEITEVENDIESRVTKGLCCVSAHAIYFVNYCGVCFTVYGRKVQKLTGRQMLLGRSKVAGLRLLCCDSWLNCELVGGQPR